VIQSPLEHHLKPIKNHLNFKITKDNKKTTQFLEWLNFLCLRLIDKTKPIIRKNITDYSPNGFQENDVREPISIHPLF